MRLVSLRALARNALVPAALGSVISPKSKSPAPLGKVGTMILGRSGF
jgi:hypothetical protein